MLVALTVKRRQQQIVIEFELGATIGQFAGSTLRAERGHLASVPERLF
jgi:hypothetical protein